MLLSPSTNQNTHDQPNQNAPSTILGFSSPCSGWNSILMESLWPHTIPFSFRSREKYQDKRRRIHGISPQTELTLPTKPVTTYFFASQWRNLATNQTCLLPHDWILNLSLHGTLASTLFKRPQRKGSLLSSEHLLPIPFQELGIHSSEWNFSNKYHFCLRSVYCTKPYILNSTNSMMWYVLLT